MGRTVAGFLNSKGGRLVIGVRDHEVAGIDEELSALYQDKHADRFELDILEYLSKSLFPPAIGNYTIGFVDLGGKKLCVIDVTASPSVTYLVAKSNSGDIVHDIYLRDGNRTIRLTDLARDRWVSIRNGGSWVLGTPS